MGLETGCSHEVPLASDGENSTMESTCSCEVCSMGYHGCTGRTVSAPLRMLAALASLAKRFSFHHSGSVRAKLKMACSWRSTELAGSASPRHVDALQKSSSIRNWRGSASEMGSPKFSNW